MSKVEENNSKLLIFSFQDPYQASNIIEPKETEVRGYDWIAWGERNNYPEYLLDLFRNVPALQSIINGCVDYTCGDDIAIANQFAIRVNTKDETINQLVRMISFDWWTYGAFALNIIRNKAGEVSDIYYLNVKDVRSDKKNERFFYSSDWSKSWGRIKYVEYPKFNINGKDASSILYVKNNWNNTYGTPVYGAATKAAELMKSIDEYQLNAINNGFMASYIISLNNGVPTPEVQAEIEKELNEKFSGYENAGRIMLSFNKSKDSEATVQKLEQPDFDKKYEALKNWSQQQLFTSFRANPALFGLPQENTGFNDQDYQQAFKLFNRTMILPVQRIIADAFKNIFGAEVLTIKPFNIDWTEDSTENNTIID